jgi:hypothetical protein
LLFVILNPSTGARGACAFQKHNGTWENLALKILSREFKKRVFYPPPAPLGEGDKEMFLKFLSPGFS